MIQRDLPEILHIERCGFRYPRTEEQFLNYLRESNHICMISENSDRVIGFMLYGLHRTHIALESLAVDHDFRRQGVGRQMADKLIAKLSAHRRSSIKAMVRETALEAQCFWRAVGFLALGVEGEYFRDSGEDGYRFEFVHRYEP
jgi:[ribosomal protein S18]-alanine N-acetyltransferase